jgi:nucleoside-diphosphate-sugar epimerase
MLFLSPDVERALKKSDARIVITGASGWIGRATLELLYNTLGPQAFADRVVAFGSSRRTIDFGAGQVDQEPLPTIAALPHTPTLVLHLAFVTKDRVAGMDEQLYRKANRTISSTVLGALDVIGATAVFVASSGAAGLANDPAASPSMRLYGSLKKADEDAFANWAGERGRRAVIARIFALSGPHINKHDNYALAGFIRDAMAGRPIAISSDFPVYRSYVAVRELMSLVFAMLDSPTGVVRFSTGGERLELQQIAEVVSGLLGRVSIERPPLRPSKIDEYAGDDAVYRRLLSAHRIEHIPFDRQIEETAAFFACEPVSSASAKRHA